MKKIIKKIALLLIVFCIGVGVTLLYTNNKYGVYEKEETKQIKKHVDTISMMLETEAKSGNYERTTRESWPTEGYVFNTTLSKCENGGELSWDDEKKVVLMSGNVSDKCYVYFDVYVPPRFDEICDETTLACHVAKLYTGTQGENGIYYHDSSLTNGAGDSSYRYSGANPNNYVCFGSNESTCPTDNLYRIIGVFGNNVKLIKYDYGTTDELGTDGDYSKTYKEWGMDSTYKGTYGDGERIGVYYWNNATQTNTWSESLLNKTNLNTNFINNIGEEWANKIATTTWKVGGNTYSNIYSKTPSVVYQNEIVSPVTTNTTDNATEYTAKIGLMYVSDYGFAADPSAWTLTMGSYNNTTATSTNWMYMGLYEWTLSRDAGYSDVAFSVYRDGNLYYYTVRSLSAVRPSFSLESSITYASGSGTQSDPIRIN